MITYDAIYDITITLGAENSAWPDDTPYSRIEETVFAKGDNWKVAALSMSSHSGTHIDLPLHLFPGKKPLDRYPVESFILPAYVIEVTDAESVKPDVLNSAGIAPGSAVLFKTENSRSGLVSSGEFTLNYVYVTAETAQMCVDKKVRLVGLDYMSVDKGGIDENPVHTVLLGNDIIILENVNLTDVPAGAYTLFCLPLKLYNGEAAPVRAALLK